MVDLTEKQHEELTERMEDVVNVLKTEIGETRAAGRARRHLYRKVVELRIAESDHLENEEAFVLPLVRERMGGVEELEVARRLLVDDDADNPRWVLEWVADELTPAEGKLLANLEANFQPASAGAR